MNNEELNRLWDLANSDSPPDYVKIHSNDDVEQSMSIAIDGGNGHLIVQRTPGSDWELMP